MGSLGFEAALAVCPAAAQAYSKYCGIVSGCENANTREGLVELSRTIDNMEGMRDGIFGDIQKLMSVLELDDARQFSNFYDFVFFISRENGQKNITVQKAVAAWRIVLIGRFRLLDRWCNFVEKYQRHNISEDAWQQLLAFSRCVNEDLEGYDPKGAWPVIIDDFVEYMHRIYRPGDCSSAMASQCSISNTFRGLNLLPGSKRKCPTQFNSSEDNVELSDVPGHSLHVTPLKRLKESSVSTKSGVSECNADPGIAVSKLPRRSKLFCKESLEVNKSKRRDGSMEATTEGPSETTSTCTIDRGGDDSPHKSCSSGIINITGAITSLFMGLRQWTWNGTGIIPNFNLTASHNSLTSLLLLAPRR